MECEKAREVFSEFLREEALNEEPMLFLEDLKCYELYYDERKILKSASSQLTKQESKNTKTPSWDLINKLYAKASEIISKYVESNSPKELNLGAHQTHTLSTWSKINDLFKQVEKYYVLEAELLEHLNPMVVFKQVKLAVNVDLKYDQFPRFIRSSRLSNFLASKSESFIRQFAIRSSTEKQIDSIRYKPSDFKSFVTEIFIWVFTIVMILQIGD